MKGGRYGQMERWEYGQMEGRRMDRWKEEQTERRRYREI
jgi:hypothetical protein